MKVTIVFLALAISLGLFAEELKHERHNIPLKDEKELDVKIEFGLGDLELKSGTTEGYILESEMTYSRDEFKPIVDYKVVGNRARLKLYTEEDKGRDIHFDFGKGKRKHGFSTENHWDLRFTNRLPISFDIEMGLGKGDLDFSGLRVSNFKLECGMSDVTVQFKDENAEDIRSFSIETGLGSLEAYGLGNTNMERFNVECGLGSTFLDFSGNFKHNAKGRVTVGLGSIEIIVPKDVGVEVEAERSFLSSISLEDFDEIDDNVFRSENWRDTKYKIYMVVEIGLGSININWAK